MAGDRISHAPPGATEAHQAVEDRIIESRGAISPLYRVLLNSPPVALGWEQLLTAIRQKTSLSPRLRELVILRIAVLNRADYEFNAHVSHALSAGLTDGEIGSIRTSDTASFSVIDKLVLEYTDAMTRDIQVSNALFSRVSTHFDAEARVELTATIAAYNMVSRFLVALHVH
jgi:4-carboxymuconolactone decarboxylase